MAEFGTKVIDKIIHDACLDWRPDPRSLEVSNNPLIFTTEFLTEFFGIDLDEFENGGYVFNDECIDLSRELKVPKGENPNTYFQQFKSFKLNTAFPYDMDRRRENFKNALFLLFMVKLRNVVMERENKAKGKPDFDNDTRDLEKKSKEAKRLVLKSKKPGGLTPAESTELDNAVNFMKNKRISRNKKHLYDNSGKGISISIDLTFTETAIHWDLINPDPMPGASPSFFTGVNPGVNPTVTDPGLNVTLTNGLSDGTYMLYCGD